MCFFRRKKQKVNRDLLRDKYEAKFEMIRTLAGEDEQLFSELEDCRVKFSKLTISENPEVFDIDDRIFSQIDELEKAMHKQSSEVRAQNARIIMAAINSLILERKYLCKELVPSKDSDFKISEGVLEKYVGNGGAVIVPTSVKIIGPRAFSANESVTAITLLEGITEIGEEAFTLCKGLKSVSLPSTLGKIGQSAFFNCPALDFVEFSDGIASIDYYAFSKCPKLKVNKIPASVTYIADNAFTKCKSLSSGAVRAIKKRNSKAVD